MFSLLQSARFFAALFVVFRHSAILFEQPEYFSYRIFGGIFRSGDAGVDFFFVLSGFIILYAHWNDVGQPDRVRRFFRKRVVRLYPAYLAVLILLFAAAQFAPGRYAESIREPLYLLKNLLLLPTADPLVTVVWTLQHEVLFYLFFGLLLWRYRLGMALFGAWFFASSVIAGPLSPAASLFTSPHHIEFLIGMAAAYLVRTRAIPLPRLLFAMGLTGFAGTCALSGVVYVDVMDSSGPNLILPLGFASFLIIVGLVEIERSLRTAAPPALRFLGDASYSLYLVHFPVLTAFAKLVRATHLQDRVPLGLLFFLGAALAVAAGALFYRLVERPLLDWLNNARGGARSRRVPPFDVRAAAAGRPDDR